jgi:hypothetical protein
MKIHDQEITHVFIDVDDTLIKTSRTLDQFSKYTVKQKTSAFKGRWFDPEDVLNHLDNEMYIPQYEDAARFIMYLHDNDISFEIISAARDQGAGRANRTNNIQDILTACGKSVHFFDDDESKLAYLNQHVTADTLTIDDKPSILTKISGVRILVNPDVNSDALTFTEILGEINE